MSDQNTPPTQPPWDFQKWIHELKRQDAQRAHDAVDEFRENMNEAAIKTSEATLRMAMLINGGAAVSVLAFIGGLVAQNKLSVADLKDVSSSLRLFAFGVVAAVIGTALAYLTHYVNAGHASSQKKIWDHPYLEPGLHTKHYDILKRVIHVFAVVAWFASIAFFVYGVYEVQDSIGRLVPPRSPT